MKVVNASLADFQRATPASSTPGIGGFPEGSYVVRHKDTHQFLKRCELDLVTLKEYTWVFTDKKEEAWHFCGMYHAKKAAAKVVIGGKCMAEAYRISGKG